MLIRVEPNEFCPDVVAQFRESGPPRRVLRVRASPPDGGSAAWCSVIGRGPDGESPANGVPVEDSGGGTMVLVFGGPWGLRLAPESGGESWGEAYLLRAPDAVA